MNDTMKQCCDENGMPDFEKMKGFMESCGKRDFSEDQIAMMREFCCKQGMPDMSRMKEMMEKCGCQPSSSVDRDQ